MPFTAVIIFFRIKFCLLRGIYMNIPEKFFNEMKKKKVAFIGIGVSNKDVIKMFAEKGIETEARDKASREKLGAAADELEAAGAKLLLGESYLDGIDADVVFRTPGMNWWNPALCALRKDGKAVTSEMEVFFDLCPCKKYGVTGSDGKTTTTTLISEFLSAAGKTVHKGGNIGRALLPIVEKIKDDDCAVVELSSFQLISMRRSPDVSVVTNVAPNHLDVHKDMEEYIEAKRNILRHQNAFSVTVLNADNVITASMAELVRGELRWFSHTKPVENGAFLREDGMLCYCEHGRLTELFPKTDIKIPGMHNVENYLTAIAAVWGEVPVEVIHNIAKNFGGVEHRIELVRELDGVKWYNDSIATSPTRTIAGLSCFDQKVILIGGGYDKHIPYEPLAPHLIDKVKLLILSGPTAPKIAAALQNDPNYNGEPEVIFVNSMEEAVATAYGYAEEGDIVTLSPASASFDLYPNFEVRGKHYKELVGKLGQLDGIPAEKL